ncbi:hypothetical protein ACMFMG_001429 [Clarireedia jacksonii]
MTSSSNFTASERSVIEPSHALLSPSVTSEPCSKNKNALNISIPNDDALPEADIVAGYDSDSSLSGLSSLFDITPPSSPGMKVDHILVTTPIKSALVCRSARKSALQMSNPSGLPSNEDKGPNTGPNVSTSNKRNSILTMIAVQKA